MFLPSIASVSLSDFVGGYCLGYVSSVLLHSTFTPVLSFVVGNNVLPLVLPLLFYKLVKAIAEQSNLAPTLPHM